MLYEKERRDQIEENQKKLCELGIGGNQHQKRNVQKKNTSQIVRRSPRFTAKDNTSCAMLENNTKNTSQVPPVRRSLRNVMVTADLGTNEVPNVQSQQNNECSNTVGGATAGDNQTGGKKYIITINNVLP